MNAEARIVKERPILFQGEMVRALLAGTKTQTRRLITPQPDVNTGYGGCTRLTFKDRKGNLLLDEAVNSPEPHIYLGLCPYGKAGDRLWVRESHWYFKDEHDPVTGYFPPKLTAEDVEYRADGEKPGRIWRPSIHMHRWASRITLEITDVRVERLHDITEADARAEGYPRDWMPGGDGPWLSPCQWYADLWKSINGENSWEVSPWVWVVSFQRIEEKTDVR